MAHKSSARGQPVQLVDARQAAKSAFAYFTTLFSNTGLVEPEPNLNLEEIEMSKDGRYWLVTLGFNVPRPNDPRLPKFMQVPLRTRSEPLPTAQERNAIAFCSSSIASPLRLERIIGEHLAGMGLEVRGNLGQKSGPEFLELLLPDPADARKFLVAGRVIPRHLAQGHVGKNDVGRHQPLVRQRLAQPPQPLE